VIAHIEAGDFITIEAQCFNVFNETGGTINDSSRIVSRDYQRFSALCIYPFEDEPPTRASGITLSNSELLLWMSSSKKLEATVLPLNAAEKGVIWSSDNPDVATVSSSGKVTSQSVGAATITAMTEDGGYTAICIVKVIEGATGMRCPGTTPPGGPHYIDKMSGLCVNCGSDQSSI
jgi:uncharacterized protein YjdB